MGSSLNKKFVRIFFSIMLISTFVSAAVILAIFYYSHDYNSIGTEERIINNISLMSRSNMKPEDIAKASMNAEWKVEVIKTNDNKGDTPTSDYDIKHTNGIIKRNDVIILNQENDIYKITHIRNQKIHIMFTLFVIGGLLLSLIIGTIIAGVASKVVLAPIVEVITVTKKIAKGDFAVRITDKKDLEYKELADNFNRMIDELNSIETLRNDFVSNISHEFKTPVASIQGFAELLKSDQLKASDRKEYLNIIIDETQRLTAMISNILLLSKIENHSIMMNKNDFDLAEQIRRVILLLEPQWTAKNIEIEVELKDMTYHGYEELLYQVWLNVLQNAVKFTPVYGKIFVTAFLVDEETYVKIVDNGIGMDDQTQKHIFEKFYQFDRSRKQEGNGLGLSLVQKIINLSGGTVTVNSKEGRGTAFTINLK